jgi:hypothetical protein
MRYGYTKGGVFVHWATGDIWVARTKIILQAGSKPTLEKGTYMGCLNDDESELDTEADEPEFG